MREIRLKESLRELIAEKIDSATNKKAIAHALNITSSGLSQFLSGKSLPKLETLIKMSNYFNVPLDYLVFFQKKITTSVVDDPLYRYIDFSLLRLMTKVEINKDSFYRITAELINKIDAAAKIIAEKGGTVAGIMTDEETFILETYSQKTDLISMNLQYSITVTEAGDISGQFLPVIEKNILLERRYRYLLPDIGWDWKPIVKNLKTKLSKNCSRSVIDEFCQFRICKVPLFNGCGIYKLDVAKLQMENPGVYEIIKDSIFDGFLGYIIPSSDRLKADILMDKTHIEIAKKGYENLWKKSEILK